MKELDIYSELCLTRAVAVGQFAQVCWYKMQGLYYKFVLQGKMILYCISNFVRTCKSNIFVSSLSFITQGGHLCS